ncbi:LysR family transcriptional regulator [Burkholderia dolosa]|nr:LysR family transcriptional regulator [Burkholderia dolosa]UEB52503.1 LysR family transcriptional regulator [Burkholderia dolosa]UEC13812.1 LysR family transcriptional regulator [Burkholderia dolosa]
MRRTGTGARHAAPRRCSARRAARHRCAAIAHDRCDARGRLRAPASAARRHPVSRPTIQAKIETEAKRLDDFRRLAHTMHFSGAARHRHLTQCAFSRRIAAMEAWMDAKPADCSVDSIALTPADRTFVASAADSSRRMYAVRDLVTAATTSRKATTSCVSRPHMRWGRAASRTAEAIRWRHRSHESARQRANVPERVQQLVAPCAIDAKIVAKPQ